MPPIFSAVKKLLHLLFTGIVLTVIHTFDFRMWKNKNCHKKTCQLKENAVNFLTAEKISGIFFNDRKNCLQYKKYSQITCRWIAPMLQFTHTYVSCQFWERLLSISIVAHLGVVVIDQNIYIPYMYYRCVSWANFKVSRKFWRLYFMDSQPLINRF